MSASLDHRGPRESRKLVASLFSRQQMFLDEPRWQTVPWELDLASKTPQSFLLDIFVTIPGLLEENSRLEKGSTYHAEDEFIDQSLVLDDECPRRAELCDRIATQLEKLYSWRRWWQKDHGRSVAGDHSGWQPHGKAVRVLRSIGNTRLLDRL
ncbi:putative Zn(2)-C6 fungal-type domain-containing protein [Seiridium cardinale]|uniref:Zn(2)-C6 fungal-type domain-containing protein n=1 Tax=Seiridium cardinale TaxID=138064 RepID=A0ABR2Y6Q3_9PEZI